MKYIFRGNIVFDYNIKSKTITIPYRQGIINTFNFCSFIVEDYLLISEYFRRIYEFEKGLLKEEQLKDIEVN